MRVKCKMQFLELIQRLWHNTRLAISKAGSECPCRFLCMLSMLQSVGQQTAEPRRTEEFD